MSVPASTNPNDIPDRRNEDDKDARRWQEAAELRQEHRAWIVIWLASHGEFRAYRRLPGARRDTALRAATASGMNTQIMQAEKPARSYNRSATGDSEPGGSPDDKADLRGRMDALPGCWPPEASRRACM